MQLLAASSSGSSYYSRLLILPTPQSCCPFSPFLLAQDVLGSLVAKETCLNISLGASVERTGFLNNAAIYFDFFQETKRTLRTLW